MTSENKQRFDAYVAAVENRINALFDGKYSSETALRDAMYYSLSAGGKRIRPVLALEFCRICGGEYEKALDAAVALEMIHTFSLIHDDLPCMDDDDYRRGRKSCHKEFDEATALLAGDALENLAYRVIADSNGISDGAKIKLVAVFSDCVKRMIDGQVNDLAYEKSSAVTTEQLISMYSQKTCALIECACLIGCICAGADDGKISAAKEYSLDMGLAFQITDDILDILGDEQTLGKPIGSDAASGKTTFAALVGADEAYKTAKKYSDDAINALSVFGDYDFMEELTDLLLDRKK